MNNDDHNIRASGAYARYSGQEYFSYPLGDRIRLFSDDDPLPPGFKFCRYDWIRGEIWVPLSEVQRLAKVRTTCTWRGHPFEVGIIEGDSANITYLGKDFDAVGGLSGLWRPDKYEVIGMVPVSELTDVKEHIEEVPLDDRSNNGAPKEAE